ncbi:unnamed protein product [Pedinophyceae sp. YPF-701]|nr:unnamed protein product [Pedinophyceae sp. YPF-701]
MFGGIPFEDFFGGGGGMPGGAGRGPPKDVDNSRFYELLGVAKDADDKEITKAYRKKAIKMHPDKGGDPEKFAEINAAYDVLKDPKKREIYDRYGEEAIKEGAASGHGRGAADIFDIFGGGGRRSPRERKAPPVQHQLRVTLEDMYNGTTRKMRMQRGKECGACNGKGTKSGREPQCSTCRGQGVVLLVQRMGPMIQQIQRPCQDCSGTGKAVPASDRCGECHGKASVPETKEFEIHVEKGMKHGDKVVLRGEGGFTEPGVLPGDIVFVLVQKETPRFKRIRADLIHTMEVSLAEALTGVNRTIEHLDGHTLSVKSKPGEVVKPQMVRKIEGKGMPLRGRPFEHGNMYVIFEVKFPDTLPAEIVASLKGLLGAPSGEDMEEDDQAEEVKLTPIADIERELRMRQEEQARAGAGTEAYDSDSEDEDGPRGVRCAQQ